MLTQLEASLHGMPLIQVGMIASFVSGGIGTLLGALPIYLCRSISRLLQDILLGFAAGIMLAATAYSLIHPAVEHATERFGSPSLGVLVVAAGLFIGAVGLWRIHNLIPHQHMLKAKEKGIPEYRLKRIWLFILAITLHNFPEGMAVGVGFGDYNLRDGLIIAIGIFIQNLPEGFIVALAVLSLGYSRTFAVGMAFLTGIVEMFGGFFGALVVSLTAALLPWGLAAAGGAMLFVISHEVIPETHSSGHETPATFSLLGGFVFMLLMQAALS